MGLLVEDKISDVHLVTIGNNYIGAGSYFVGSFTVGYDTIPARSELFDLEFAILHNGMAGIRVGNSPYTHGAILRNDPSPYRTQALLGECRK